MSRNQNYTRWSLDFTSLDNSRVSRAIRSPIGFSQISGPLARGDERNVIALSAQDDREKLKIKKAWDVAFAPAKSIPMNAFMLWMSGGGVQIFSIMITAMLFFQPIKAIAGISQMFERYEPLSRNGENNLLMQKLTFFGVQIATMLLGIWKLSSMGLLPTATSDWLAFLEPKTATEFSAS